MPLYSGREPAVETVNNNAYYRPGKPLGGEIFFKQGWGAWRGKGFDNASLLNVDPGFGCTGGRLQPGVGLATA